MVPALNQFASGWALCAQTGRKGLCLQTLSTNSSFWSCYPSLCLKQPGGSAGNWTAHEMSCTARCTRVVDTSPDLQKLQTVMGFIRHKNLLRQKSIRCVLAFVLVWFCGVFLYVRLKSLTGYKNKSVEIWIYTRGTRAESIHPQQRDRSTVQREGDCGEANKDYYLQAKNNCKDLLLVKC